MRLSALASLWRLAAAALTLGAAAFAGTVTITSPANNATVPSPIHVTSSAASSTAIKLSQVYLDGVKKYEVASASVNTYVSTTSGTHRLTVQAYDSNNSIFKSTVYVTAGGTTSTTTTSTSTTTTSTSTTTSTTLAAPSTALTFANIDQMTGWQSCGACAGAGGTGPNTPNSIQQGISSPSLDGSSAQFNISPQVAYSDALWWKQLGAQPAASHFIYDVYFYVKNPAAIQALEFDVNQSVNGGKYIFGTECDIRGTHTWRVWDYNMHWVSTGVTCSVPTAYTWHHLTWEFERVSGKTHFVALTLDGVTNYVNQYHTPQPSSVSELNVAFQMDSSSTTPFSGWLDKVSLKYW